MGEHRYPENLDPHAFGAREVQSLREAFPGLDWRTYSDGTASGVAGKLRVAVRRRGYGWRVHAVHDARELAVAVGRELAAAAREVRGRLEEIASDVREAADGGR